MTRRVSIDWLRGVAVLCMIEWHVLEAWSVAAGRETFAWDVIGSLGGLAAPLVFVGGWVGGLLARALSPAAATAGLTLEWLAAAVPSLRPRVVDPAGVGWRTGLLLAMLWVAWSWTRRSAPAPASALLTFGRTSLVVYWVHVELASGIFSYPPHRALPLGWALAGLAAMIGLMLALARWWDLDAPRFEVPAHMAARFG